MAISNEEALHILDACGQTIHRFCQVYGLPPSEVDIKLETRLIVEEGAPYFFRKTPIDKMWGVPLVLVDELPPGSIGLVRHTLYESHNCPALEITLQGS